MVHRNRGSLIGILRHIAGGLLLVSGIVVVSAAWSLGFSRLDILLQH